MRNCPPSRDASLDASAVPHGRDDGRDGDRLDRARADGSSRRGALAVRTRRAVSCPGDRSASRHRRCSCCSTGSSSPRSSRSYARGVRGWRQWRAVATRRRVSPFARRGVCRGCCRRVSSASRWRVSPSAGSPRAHWARDSPHGSPPLPIAVEQSLRVSVGAIVALASVTYLHVVFGELAPRAVALNHPEQLARWLAPPLMVFAWLVTPFIAVLNRSSQAVLKHVRPARRCAGRVGALARRAAADRGAEPGRRRDPGAGRGPASRGCSSSRRRTRAR